jgi:hypothetical protein
MEIAPFDPRARGQEVAAFHMTLLREQRGVKRTISALHLKGSESVRGHLLPFEALHANL